MDPMTKMASAISDGPEEQLEETFESMTVDQLDDLLKNGGEGAFIGQIALDPTWEEKTAMVVEMGIEMAKTASAERKAERKEKTSSAMDTVKKGLTGLKDIATAKQAREGFSKAKGHFGKVGDLVMQGATKEMASGTPGGEPTRAAMRAILGANEAAKGLKGAAKTTALYGGGAAATGLGVHAYKKHKAKETEKTSGVSIMVPVGQMPVELDEDRAAKMHGRLGAVTGAAATGLAGAGLGSHFGNKGAIIGGLGGAALGGLGGHALGSWSGRKGAKDTKERMMANAREKMKMMDALRDEHKAAHPDLYKTKTSGLGGMAGMAAKGINAVGGTGAMQAVGKAANKAGAYGAAIGGGLGAARGLLKNPGTDPQTGQKKSRLWAAAKGGVGGAALGGAAGYGGSTISSNLSRMSPTAAHAMGNARNWAAGQVGKAKQFGSTVYNEAKGAIDKAPMTVQASVDFEQLAGDFTKRTR